MREAVDSKFRERHLGFRMNRFCTDQIATLRIILEQSLKRNSPLYIHFIGYKNVFDREMLWGLLRLVVDQNNFFGFGRKGNHTES
jgi:hypothetical protein